MARFTCWLALLLLMVLVIGCSTETPVESQEPSLPRYDYCEADSDCILAGNNCRYFSVNSEAEYEDYKSMIPYPPNCKDNSYYLVEKLIEYCDEHPCDSHPISCENNTCQVEFTCGNCEFVRDRYDYLKCEGEYPPTLGATECRLLSSCNCS